MPAEAVTIHKSQGQTYHAIVTNLPARRSLSCNLMYVACSHAVNASGLYIIGTFHPPAAQANEALRREIEQQREAPIIPVFSFLHEPRGMTYQFLFHNIQSSRRHIDLVRYDAAYLSSDFLLFAETWTSTSDNPTDLAIEGFELVT